VSSIAKKISLVVGMVLLVTGVMTVVSQDDSNVPFVPTAATINSYNFSDDLTAFAEDLRVIDETSFIEITMKMFAFEQRSV
jgi:hypothetical protein